MALSLLLLKTWFYKYPFFLFLNTKIAKVVRFSKPALQFFLKCDCGNSQKTVWRGGRFRENKPRHRKYAPRRWWAGVGARCVLA